MLKSHADVTVRPLSTSTLMTWHATPRPSTATTNTDTADKRSAVRFDDHTRSPVVTLSPPAKMVRCGCGASGRMLRATRSRFEEDRLDEPCARAHERGKARGALDEAGCCANVEGARVPAQVQRKDVHLFFGRIRGRHVCICFVAVGVALACSCSCVGDDADADDRFESIPGVVVRVHGAARACEEGPAARSGDVAHVQDPYSSPQVALPLLGKSKGHRAARRARHTPHRPSRRLVCTSRALRIWAGGVQRRPPRLQTTHTQWLRRAHT